MALSRIWRHLWLSVGGATGMGGWRPGMLPHSLHHEDIPTTNPSAHVSSGGYPCSRRHHPGEAVPQLSAPAPATQAPPADHTLPSLQSSPCLGLEAFVAQPQPWEAILGFYFYLCGCSQATRGHPSPLLCGASTLPLPVRHAPPSPCCLPCSGPGHHLGEGLEVGWAGLGVCVAASDLPLTTACPGGVQSSSSNQDLALLGMVLGSGDGAPTSSPVVAFISGLHNGARW